MATSILLIGIGGFGKWVVTAFKNRLLERYGKVDRIPETFKYIAFDLEKEESPNPQFYRFGFGKCEIDKLDYTTYSNEFYLFKGDYQHEIEKIQNDATDKNPFISEFISKKDADLYVINFLKEETAAGLMRLTGRTVFFLDAEEISRRLGGFLKDNCLCFIVSSIAGGTGCGSLHDFLILLQKIIKEKNFRKFYRIPIFLLPRGFKKAREEEKLTVSEANCYAFLREFQRIDLPDTKIDISYSHSLKNIQKLVTNLADFPIIIDGSKIGGEEGDKIPYYEGTVISVIDFIESFWYAEEYESSQEARGVKIPMSYGNIIKNYIPTNRNLAKDNPEDSLIYQTFGTFKWLFDGEMIKREFAQKIAIDILKQYLEAPDINPQKVAQDFLKDATNFTNLIVYDLVNKGISQMKGFAKETSLESKLEETTPYERKIKEKEEPEKIDLPDFPKFLFDTEIRLTGNVANAFRQLTNYESSKFGVSDDRCNLDDLAHRTGRRTYTYFAVLNFYQQYYVDEFKKALQDEILKILHRDKDQPTYGKGSLNNALVFLTELKHYYDKFLGDAKAGIESEFEKAKAEASLPNYAEEISRFVEMHGRRRYKYLKDLRAELRKKYKDWNIQKRRTHLWATVKKIAEENLSYIKYLIEQIEIWISTFDEGKKWIEKRVLSDIRFVRNEKRNIKCHQYLTKPEDEWEYTMYEIIRGRRSIKKEEKESNPVFAKLPLPSWKEIVKCFSWGFNFKTEDEELLPDPRRPEGALICIVDKEKKVKMPDWPFKDEFWKEDQESILTWNNQLTEYYITCGLLNDLNKISVMDMFFWQGKTPEEITSAIEKKTSIMLNFDERKQKDIEGRFEKIQKGVVKSKIEKSVIRGFLETELPIKSYKTFLAQIKKNLENLKYLIMDGEKDELLVSRCLHLLTINAMPDISNTKNSYLDIMNGYLADKCLSPHVFPGEKVAYLYESKIAKKEKKTYPELLHHEVVSVLKDKPFVQTILFAKIFGVEIEEYKDGEMNDRIRVKFKSAELVDLKKEDFYWVKVIAELLYPSEEKKEKYQDALENLKKEVINLINIKKREGTYGDTLNTGISKLEEELKSGNLHKADQDLYKVWIIMLEEEVL